MIPSLSSLVTLITFDNKRSQIHPCNVSKKRKQNNVGRGVKKVCKMNKPLCAYSSQRKEAERTKKKERS